MWRNTVTGNVKDFLSWCAQFRGFEYGTVSYWIDVYERGDGTDMYGRNIELMDGRTLKKRP
jgi:hypothetical protein